MTVAMRLMNAALKSTRAVKRMRAEYRFIIGGVLKVSTYFMNHFYEVNLRSTAAMRMVLMIIAVPSRKQRRIK